jgi:hypothetical protein
MKDIWTKDITTAIELISNVASELDRLGCSFEDTGNTIIGDKLYTLSRNLSNYSEMVRKTISKKIDEDFNLSQQSTANMINGILAMQRKEE